MPLLTTGGLAEEATAEVVLDRGGSGRVVELGTPAVILARDGAYAALGA